MNHAMRTREIFRHDARGEAIRGAIRALDGFVFFVEYENAHDRPEDLLAHDSHVVVATGEYGWLYVLTLRIMIFCQTLAARDQTRAFCNAAFYIAEHLLQLRGAHERAKVGGGLGRRTDANTLHAFEQQCLEALDHIALHEHARAVRADLARAEEVGAHRDVGGAFEIRVVEHEQRGLAAEFHRHFFQRRRARHRHHLLARFDAARERNLFDVRMRGQHRAHAAVALHDVEHARRHAGFGV